MKRVISFAMWPVLYFYNIGRALDQLGTALLGQDIDWTISAWIGSEELRGKPWARWAALAIGFLFQDEAHCFKAWMADTCEGENSVGRMHERWLAGEPILYVKEARRGG